MSILTRYAFNSSYLAVADTSGPESHMNGAKAWTMSTWAYVPTGGEAPLNFGAIFSKGNAAGTTLTLELQWQTVAASWFVVFGTVAGAGVGTADSGTALTTDTFKHYAVVFNGAGSSNDDKIKLYIDGVDQGALTFAGEAPESSLITTDADLLMGVRPGGTGGWNAMYVYNPKMWEAALTPQEIATDVFSFEPCRPQSLRFWAPADSKNPASADLGGFRLLEKVYKPGTTVAAVGLDYVGSDNADGGDPALVVQQLGSQPPYPSIRSMDGHTRRQAQRRVHLAPGHHRGM